MKTILVVDYGSQFAQIIARKIREQGVYTYVCSYKKIKESLKKFDVIGIVLSGGPNSVYEKNAPSIEKELVDSFEFPILGICYGAQLIAHINGFKVKKAKFSEYGNTEIKLENSDLFKNIDQKNTCYMSHNDKILSVSGDFEIISATSTCPVAGFRHKTKDIYGIQFHAEVEHTPFGKELLKNFVFNICKAKINWSNEMWIENKIKKIKETIGENKAICALSGGVDSSVAATLVQKAIGNKLYCIYVDSGLMRKYETENVIKIFKEDRDFNLIVVDAKKRFISKLTGVSDPETKRKIIGEEFIRIFEEEAAKIKDANFLVQGTIYSDVVESGTDTSATIKSHHNVGGLPKDIKFTIIEPIKDLFKDEVRKVGLELQIPKRLVFRQPFPGPGLAIRILGEITEEKIRKVREADWILRDEFAKAGLDKTVWQYFAILPNVSSIGVMGDSRTYMDAIALRAVNSVDGMTASTAEIPHEILQKISTRIVNEVAGVNRVLYDITTKPPASIEWE